MNTIEIKNLNKKIKGAEVLKDINLHLEGGKVYGLKGKNGSGKTMLMRAVCGLILPTGGSITINGEQLGKQISFPRSVGILIENPSFIPGYTGLKNLSVLAAIQKRVGEDEIRETLEKIGLDPDDKRTYRKYSLGMKQRLGIAAAVMENPDIEEPGAAVIVRTAGRIPTVFSEIAQYGYSSEALARSLGKQIRSFLAASAPIESHLADQIILPLFFAAGGIFLTKSSSEHLESCIKILELFTGQKVKTERDGKCLVVNVPKLRRENND